MTVGKACKDLLILKWYKYSYNYGLLCYLIFSFIKILDVAVIDGIAAFVLYITSAFLWYGFLVDNYAKAMKDVQAERASQPHKTVEDSDLPEIEVEEP